MQMPIQITFRNVAPSPAVEEAIRDRATRLERFAHRITGWHVMIQALNDNHHKGRLYRCTVHIHVPGREIVVGHDGPLDHAHEDVYVTIRQAFDAARRQLEDYVRKIRDDVKSHEEQVHGTIAKLAHDDGYGFIELDDGQEIYFHQNSVLDGRFDTLKKGARVRVVIAEGEGEKGPQASTVAVIGNMQ